MSASEDMGRDQRAAAPDGSPGGVEPPRPPLINSAQLLRGHRTVEIHHNGELYRLQATRTGKLILTK